MIQRECPKCRKYSEAVSHGYPCPFCEHDLNFYPFKVIIVSSLAFVGLLAALWSALR